MIGFALFFLGLGISIGALAMWLYMMQKYAGRPIHWPTIIQSAVISAGVALWMWWVRHGF